MHIRDMYAYRREPERVRSLAVLYWRLVLSAAALVVVLSLGYGAFQLFSILQETNALDAGGTTVRSALALDQKQLESALAAFTARGNRFEALKTNALAIPDPSN